MKEATFDYYDPNPTVILDRPLVISGMIQLEVRKLAYRLAALHGLRFADLERSMEHRFGASTAELESRQLPHEVRRLESQMLAAALVEAPHGVIAVSDAALSMRSNQRLIEQRAFFVALDYTVDDCYRRFRRLYPDSAPGWIAEAPSAASLTSLYRQWTERFRGAHLTLPMAEQSWESATMALVERLGREHPAFAGN